MHPQVVLVSVPDVTPEEQVKWFQTFQLIVPWSHCCGHVARQNTVMGSLVQQSLMVARAQVQRRPRDKIYSSRASFNDLFLARSQLLRFLPPPSGPSSYEY